MQGKHSVAWSARRRVVALLLTTSLVAGLAMIAYPTVSNVYNEHLQGKVIAEYSASVDEMSSELIKTELEAASEYNNDLAEAGCTTIGVNAMNTDILDISGNGVIGHIEIPKISQNLPIYSSSASETHLDNGTKLLSGTSLPVGGESAHSVIYSHRGLPGVSLFTNLDKLELGDIFYITVLGEVLTYEVDQILTIEPDDTTCLEIEEGRDLCTLLTCTPYGINTHRLCVRGSRVETENQALESGTEFASWHVMIIAIFAIALFLGLFWFIRKRIRRCQMEKRFENYLSQGWLNMFLLVMCACISFSFTPNAEAATYRDMNLETLGSITVLLTDSSDNTLADTELKVYCIGIFVESEGAYELQYCTAFETLESTLSASRLLALYENSSSELSSLLLEFIETNAGDISHTSVFTENDGSISIYGLELGVYLICGDCISPFLVSVPYEDENVLHYSVYASPKILSTSIDTGAANEADTDDGSVQLISTSANTADNGKRNDSEGWASSVFDKTKDETLILFAIALLILIIGLLICLWRTEPKAD